MIYKNHYALGSNQTLHKSKIIAVSNKDAVYDNLTSLENSDVEIGYVPAGYEHRPDLISNYFYGTTTKDWMIMMFNNIKDPFQELNVGDRILIPKQ